MGPQASRGTRLSPLSCGAPEPSPGHPRATAQALRQQCTSASTLSLQPNRSGLPPGVQSEELTLSLPHPVAPSALMTAGLGSLALRGPPAEICLLLARTLTSKGRSCAQDPCPSENNTVWQRFTGRSWSDRDLVTEPKLMLLATWQVSKLGDVLLEQEILTLIGRPADPGDGWPVSPTACSSQSGRVRFYTIERGGGAFRATDQWQSRALAGCWLTVARLVGRKGPPGCPTKGWVGLS